MSNLTDVVAERALVAYALHGSALEREEARAVLEVFPPSTRELVQLLRGRTPTLNDGLREQRLVLAAWPPDEAIHELVQRLWRAQARRELMRVAISGTDAEVRRCWAVLRYMEAQPAVADPPETKPRFDRE